MTAPNYAQMSTDELIRQFAETAKRAGSIWNDSLPLIRTPERKQAADDIQPIGAELRSRKPIEKLRQLFQDESPDVRWWAGGQFLGIDPIWASAAMSGLSANLTTKEVLAWRDRTLAGPPPGPPIKEMTIAQLVDRFQDACTRLYATTRFLSDEEGGGLTMIAYNHISGEPHQIAKELSARDRLDALVPLLDDPLITVRQKAATYCLPAAPEKALAALAAVRATKKWPEFWFVDATIDSWKKGTYQPFA